MQSIFQLNPHFKEYWFHISEWKDFSVKSTFRRILIPHCQNESIDNKMASNIYSRGLINKKISKRSFFDLKKCVTLKNCPLGKKMNHLASTFSDDRAVTNNSLDKQVSKYYCRHCKSRRQRRDLIWMVHSSPLFYRVSGTRPSATVARGTVSDYNRLLYCVCTPPNLAADSVALIPGSEHKRVETR